MNLNTIYVINVINLSV